MLFKYFQLMSYCFKISIFAEICIKSVTVFLLKNCKIFLKFFKSGLDFSENRRFFLKKYLRILYGNLLNP